MNITKPLRTLSRKPTSPRGSLRQSAIVAASVAAIVATSISQAQAADNGTLLQAFEWESSADGEHWNRLADAAQDWTDKGITAFWLPPAYKGGAGGFDVGYGVYDIWDLGEFDQQQSVRTKYGTKQQYLDAIDAIHAADGLVYADIVLNHKMNADATDRHQAVRVSKSNRNNEYWDDVTVDTWTNFTFPGRRDPVTGELEYNDFEWRWYHFDGADYAENLGADGCTDCRLYKFRGAGKNWDSGVSLENGNYDYLMGADIDFDHPDVRAHLKEWGEWYTTIAKLDGFRMDATKHIPATWYNEWLYHVRAATGRADLFAVSEYWDPNIGSLNNYTNTVNSGNDRMSVFDVPLHQNFHQASNAGGFYDMGSIYNNSLVNIQPQRAVTFVDNHDSLDGRSLPSKVQDWFKPLAYTLIMLRRDGYPTVFLGDYEGVVNNVASQSSTLDTLMAARKFHAYGNENLYLNHADIVGFTREGDADHWYGVAVLMSDGPGGSKWMKVGGAHANQCFEDVTGNVSGVVCANGSGWGEFRTAGGKASVWVRQGKFGRYRD